MRVDGIGDALACAPLLASLREAGHTVSALLTTKNAGVFAPAAFERTHVVERIPWPRHDYTPGTWGRALSEARAARYDAAIVASEEPLAYTFAKQAGIPRRTGFHNGVQKPFKSLWARMQLTRAVYRSASLPARPEAEPQTLFRLGAGLVFEAEPTKDLARLRPLIADEAAEPRSGTLVQLTPKWTARDRTIDDVADWIGDLRRVRRATVIAAEGERGEIQGIAARGGFPVSYFSDQRAWVNAIAAAELLITPDTGAAHVAGMTGTPVVDIFEREKFARYSARWIPWAAQRVRLLTFASGSDKETFGTELLRAAEMAHPVRHD